MSVESKSESHLPHTVPAYCGCSLTACHEGILQSPDPRLHLQLNMGRVLGDYDMTDGERRGFCRMLDLKEPLPPGGRDQWDGLTEEWRSLFRLVIRNEITKTVEERVQVYRLLGLGDPSPAEQAAWAQASVLPSSMPYDQGMLAPESGSSFQTPPPGSQWVSGASRRDHPGDSAQGPQYMYSSQGAAGTSHSAGGFDYNDGSQLHPSVQFRDYSQPR